MDVLDTNNGTCTSQKTRQVVRKHSCEAEESKINKHKRKQIPGRKNAEKSKKRSNKKASLGTNIRGIG